MNDYSTMRRVVDEAIDAHWVDRLVVGVFPVVCRCGKHLTHVAHRSHLREAIIRGLEREADLEREAKA